jgi:hypothetical protein
MFHDSMRRLRATKAIIAGVYSVFFIVSFCRWCRRLGILNDSWVLGVSGSLQMHGHNFITRSTSFSVSISAPATASRSPQELVPKIRPLHSW